MMNTSLREELAPPYFLSLDGCFVCSHCLFSCGGCWVVVYILSFYSGVTEFSTQTLKCYIGLTDRDFSSLD